MSQTNHSYPMLMSLKPVAAVVGQATEHELNARYNLAGGKGVFISGSGVTAEVLPLETEKPEDQDRNDVTASKCKLRIKCDSDALPGVRDFRVWTPHGASTVGQLVIVRESVVSEVPDNDIVEKAQNIALPATICGAIEKAEDIDLYKIRIDQAGEWTFHMTSQRLQNRLHDMQIRVDPMITLRNMLGSTLASSDNTFAGDPLLQVRVEAPGDYLLEVRDVRYQGNVDWNYSIECSSRPFAKVVRPMSVASGMKSSLQIVGYGLPTDASYHWTAPTISQTRVHELAPTLHGIPLNTIQAVVTPDPIVHEKPSQENSGLNISEVPLIPAMICGAIDEAGQVDRFEFTAEAQRQYSFELISRRLGSSLDAKLRVLNTDGNSLSEVDDMIFERVLSSDPMLENWTAPANGKYFIEVRDLHGRGGIDYPYSLHMTIAKPYFLLEADTDKTMLAGGSAGVIYVKAHRRNGFSGDIQLHVEGLPAGVCAETGRILSTSSDGAIWLTATQDAPMGMTNIQIRGTALRTDQDGKAAEIAVSASNLQEVYLPGGGRGHYPVQMHTVSVGKPMDIRKIRLSTSHIELQPGTSKRVEIEVERSPEYKGNVTLDAMLQHLEQPYGNPLPPGVSVDVSSSKTLLGAGENAGYITFKAAHNAPLVERHLVPITVHVSINFVMKHTFSGDPFFISVKSH